MAPLPQPSRIFDQLHRFQENVLGAIGIRLQEELHHFCDMSLKLTLFDLHGLQGLRLQQLCDVASIVALAQRLQPSIAILGMRTPGRHSVGSYLAHGVDHHKGQLTPQPFVSPLNGILAHRDDFMNGLRSILGEIGQQKSDAERVGFFGEPL